MGTAGGLLQGPGPRNMVSGGAMALCLAVLAALLVSAATRGAELRVGPRRALADEPNHPNAGSHRHPAWPGGPCDLCARNWLFVLSAYRTGSTTALSMFSSIPGFEIGGEHDGVLVPEADVFARLQHAQQTFGAAFDGSRHEMDQQLLSCNIQDLMESVILGKDYAEISPRTVVLGFKEIRYNNFRMLRFINRVFPCSRILFTMREDWRAPVNAKGLDPAQFGWVHNNWRQFGELARRVHDKFPSTTALLPLEKVSVETYNHILHNTTGVRGCSFTNLLHENLDGSALHDPAKQQPFLSGECDLSGVNFRLGPVELLQQDRLWEELQAELEEACKTDDERCVLMS